MRKDDVVTGLPGEPPIRRDTAVRRVLLESFLASQLQAGAVRSNRVSFIKIQEEVALPAARALPPPSAAFHRPPPPS